MLLPVLRLGCAMSLRGWRAMCVGNTWNDFGRWVNQRLTAHRNINALLIGEVRRFLVTGVHVPNNADSGIIG